eukprot:TRINITY_DN25093_c0_g1_i1.p1 TRINITY_DN25093_c0_g1~~TRINITY_DN25093_c0_g1_i1.p1  ORF type:complete len:391 (+),score=75.47 TRINITY_DN25093_c0_g1_i1:38-1210(+)
MSSSHSELGGSQHDGSLLSRLQQARDAARNRGRVSGVIEQSKEKVRSIEETLSCFDKELGVRGGMERTAMQDAAYYNKVTANSREMIKESLSRIRAPIATLETTQQPASTRREQYAELERQISSLQASSASALRNHQMLSQNIKRSLGTPAATNASLPSQQQQRNQSIHQPDSQVSSYLRRTEELQRKLKECSEQNRLNRAALQNNSHHSSVDTNDSVGSIDGGRQTGGDGVAKKEHPEQGHRSGYSKQPQPEVRQYEEEVSSREGSPISINAADLSLRMERERQDKLWQRLAKCCSETQNGPSRRDLDRLLTLRKEFLAEERHLAMCELGLLLEKRLFKDKLTRIKAFASTRATEINRNGPNYNEGILLDAVCNVIKTELPSRTRGTYS